MTSIVESGFSESFDIVQFRIGSNIGGVNWGKSTNYHRLWRFKDQKGFRVLSFRIVDVRTVDGTVFSDYIL